MKTNDLAALNRQIAEAKGWTKADDPFQITYEEWLEVAKELYPFPEMHRPVKIPPVLPQYWHNPDKPGESQMLPDWSTDPAAALELLREMNDDLPGGQRLYMLWPTRDGWRVGRPPHYESIAYPTAAEAIARAWLAWHEGREGEGE